MEGCDGLGTWNDGADEELSALRSQKAKIENEASVKERKQRVAEEKELLRKQIMAAGRTPVA